MSKKLFRGMACGAWMLGLAAGSAFAGEVVFTDPVGDDNGPGNYTYPTDVVYTPGSFDLTKLAVRTEGGRVDFEVNVNAPITNPWGMKSGFSVQMVFIFIDTDGKEGSGNTKTLPGLNVEFAPKDSWDKVIVLSPQPASRVKTEVNTKAAALKDSVIVPGNVAASGRKITASVNAKDIGAGDPLKWGYQVVMQSNEGFPAPSDLLTRKVNQFEGQHRFGGGTDGDCDPHAIDILSGDAKGAAAEADAQHTELKYEVAPDKTCKTKATLTMVHAK